MKPKDRQLQILSYLRAMQREFQVEELAETLQVSPLTIRRDLDHLSRQKAIIRTYGGCITASVSALEDDYHRKVALNYDKKQAIGKAAAGHVLSGDVIVINDGSTTYHLASHLGEQQMVTVFTNSIAMIAELSRLKNCRLFILGGEYRTGFNHLSGSLTGQILEKMCVDTVFLGADAVDSKGRCFADTVDDASLAQMMLRAGRKRILLADTTKFHAASCICYASLEEFDLFITNEDKDISIMTELRKMTTIQEVKV